MKEFQQKALEMRRDIVRMIYAAGSGHPGGSLSMVEILTALFFKIMNKKPDDPRWEDRDRFILSKGHGVPALYAALAHSGYFPTDELVTLRKLGSPLQGHPDYSRLPAVEASTGSLGQGLSVALGIALAGKLQQKDYRTICAISDGEHDEGNIWEAALFAPNHEVNNLTVVVDYNKYQLDGAIDDILPIEPVEDKWQAFGWKTKRIDGHNLEEVITALESAYNDEENCHAIIADTIKGKGVSFMEGNNDFHGRAPTDEEYIEAMQELGVSEEEAAL